MGKGTYGLMAGLGEGIVQAGGMFMQDAMRARSDERATNRQKSLEEIRQQFQMSERDRQNAYDAAAFTDPSSPQYKAQLIKDKRAHKNAIELAEARGQSYRTNLTSPINRKDWTAESYQDYLNEMDQLLNEDPNLTQVEAHRVAAAKLVRVPATSSNADTTNRNKLIAEETALFKEQGIDGMRETIAQYYPSMTEESIAALSFRELVKMFQDAIAQEWPGGGGLMNGQQGGPVPSSGNNNEDPAGIL